MDLKSKSVPVEVLVKPLTGGPLTLRCQNETLFTVAIFKSHYENINWRVASANHIVESVCQIGADDDWGAEEAVGTSVNCLEGCLFR